MGAVSYPMAASQVFSYGKPVRTVVGMLSVDLLNGYKRSFSHKIMAFWTKLVPDERGMCCRITQVSSNFSCFSFPFWLPVCFPCYRCHLCSISVHSTTTHCPPQSANSCHCDKVETNWGCLAKTNSVAGPIKKNPPPLKNKKQKTHSSLTECISNDKYKCVSALCVPVLQHESVRVSSSVWRPRKQKIWQADPRSLILSSAGLPKPQPTFRAAFFASSRRLSCPASSLSRC